MPGTFIFAIILFVIAVLGLAFGVGSWFLASSADDKKFGAIIGGGVTLVAAGLALIVTLCASYDRVDTRNVGIITSFGKPVGVSGAGIVWHAPWKRVSELSEAIQLQAFDGEGPGKGNLVQVRLGNNSSAWIAENLNWRLVEGAAPQLFQDYGGSNLDVFANIRDNLVDRQAAVALSQVFAKFDPTAMEQGADLPVLADEVKRDLQHNVGTQIEILSVRIPKIFYDEPTQQRIDQHNQKVQETKNALQDVQTAKQQRAANEERNAAPALPGGVPPAIALCLHDTVADHRDPSGCWGQIGGTPLIQVPAAK